MIEVLNARVHAQSLVETIVQRLEAAIMSGELAPGSKLSEQALAKRLGVSRGPLREAIRRLEGRKLVQRTPNIGPRVAALSHKDLLDILVVREALEGIACRLATMHMTKEEVAELDSLLDEHGRQEGVRKGKGYYQQGKNFDFHFRIAKASRNDRLLELLCGDLYDLLKVYRYQSSAVRGRAGRAYDEHRRIVKAIAARDPDRAETLMRRHIANARLNIEAEMRLQEEAGKGTDEVVAGRPGARARKTGGGAR